ncbi:hypothetical protein CRUP_006397, partial [Coryphaenoides rupestris]
MPANREKGVVEIQLRDIQRDQEGDHLGLAKQKEEKKEIFTKVVIRRLPPSLSREQLEEQLSPLPSFDYFEFFPADQSLHPHLFSRAYINFKSNEDILHFRDRFDGYVFIDNKGQEYPAVVEFAPFQKISKKKLKKKDTKAGSIEEDPEYKRFLENYSCDEEKSMANPETLLGEIEAKTRELIAKRTTPLLEYIKNKKLEKQRIREEKREERRRRELERKRQREEEKRKRREEERRKRRELLKKSDREEDVDSEHLKDKGDEVVEAGDRSKWEKPGYCQDRAKKEGAHHHSHHHHSHHHGGFSYCPDGGDKLGKDDREDASSRKERLRNKVSEKDRPAMQLYQPGARNRKRMSSAGKGYDGTPAGRSPEPGAEPCFEVVTMGTGSEKSRD